ncbi:MAG: hypothetical protein GX418_05245 [Clostridiales bacterium]|nr:hypothetical protein [Clostridiales bacterium]
MNRLNRLIRAYTLLLQKQEIQMAYRGIMDYLGKLRAEFVRRYPQWEVGGLYQGYMDMSYFSIGSQALKELGLKIALVYLHEKGCFEVWLSARNRELARRYEAGWHVLELNGIAVHHEPDNPDAILEQTLVAEPDFEKTAWLTECLCQGVAQFMEAVRIHLSA